MKWHAICKLEWNIYILAMLYNAKHRYQACCKSHTVGIFSEMITINSVIKY